MKTDFLNPTHPGDSIQEEHTSVPRNSSYLDENYDLDQTLRFGEITPHFVFDAYPKDRISLRSGHALRSFSIKAPLQQSISLKKDYFSVPMECIYPFQWERIFANPNIGDDVPSDAYGNVDLHSIMAGCIEYLQSSIEEDLVAYNALDPDDEEALQACVAKLIKNGFAFFNLLMYVYSNGSLLNYLGCCLVPNCYFTQYADGDASGGVRKGYFSVDRVFDQFISYCFGSEGESMISSFTLTSAVHRFYKEVVWDGSLDDNDFHNDSVSPRRFLELLHDNGFVGVSSFSGDENNLVYFLLQTVPYVHFVSGVKPIDLSRLFAYQIVCAHFYSNDRVDYIYSAELWRQNLLNHYLNIAAGTLDAPFTFSYNGSSLPYDYTSSKYFSYYTDMGTYTYTAILSLFAYIFAFRKSLRFIDYFTGAKTSPLAVGDTDIDVSNENKVSVVDVTRNIQMQRFLNAVNRMRRNLSGYIKGLFGVSIAPDFHNPLYLGHTSDVVYGQEVQNTGEAQQTQANSVTSVLKGNANSHAFEFSPDRPSIILGLCYFDISRHYSKSIDRQFFIKDRFDMYNPFLEYIGDQVVYTDELVGRYLLDDAHDTDIFGYQTRYSEFKQRISRAVGGYVEYLPGYAFLSDNVPGLAVYPILSPDYVRSHPLELDEFFVALTGYSLASYFHFQLTQFNNCVAVRDMARSPQIL